MRPIRGVESKQTPFSTSISVRLGTGFLSSYFGGCGGGLSSDQSFDGWSFGFSGCSSSPRSRSVPDIRYLLIENHSLSVVGVKLICSSHSHVLTASSLLVGQETHLLPRLPVRCITGGCIPWSHARGEQVMILERGDKVLVVHRRLFETDGCRRRRLQSRRART